MTELKQKDTRTGIREALGDARDILGTARNAGREALLGTAGVSLVAPSLERDRELLAERESHLVGSVNPTLLEQAVQVAKASPDRAE